MLHWNFLRDTKSSFQEAPGSMQHYMVLKGERACFLRNSFPGDGSWATGPWQMVAHHYDAGLQTQSKLEYFPHPTHRFPGEGWGLCSDLLGLVLNLICWETNSDVSGALLLSTTFLAGWLTDCLAEHSGEAYSTACSSLEKWFCLETWPQVGA